MINWIITHLVPGASGAENFFKVAIGAVGDLFDPHMWESLGWIILGAALIFTGVQLWIGPAAARTAGQLL